MGNGVRRFTSLRAWQACDAFKKAVYCLCDEMPLANDWRRRQQLEKAASGPPAHVAEGFGRFSPPDSARFAVIARSSLMEAQNHLLDAVDRGYISEERRQTLNALAETALREVTGWLEYLQSPEAIRNARRARERRINSRHERRARSQTGASHEPRTGTPNPNPEPPNPELEHEPEHEPRTENPEE